MSYVNKHFTCQDQIALPNLDAELYCFEHPSGFKHYHLRNDDPHRAASLAFRTLPTDNSGLPHILEHSVLCGSQRYPVRDPFFMMLRRSMQTFMNAMTGADCTWYPIASLNEEDFFNLFAVYSDAVFQPNLDPLDIAQEAWRWEIDNDKTSISGIVYNEMKGAYADRDAILYQALCTNMLPDTPYRFDSGGDPCSIPDLSTADVHAFHQRYYQAHNACCCSYGDIDVQRLQDQLSPYLHVSSNTATHIPLQKPAFNEREIQVDTPVDPESADEESIICAWLWGDGSDPLHNMLSSILEDLLLGHAAAPLRLALESSGLCRSIDGSGFLDYCRNGIMSIEMHGCQICDKSALLDIINDCIDQITINNFPDTEIDAAIKQNDLHERYIGGEREPFGLQLCESVIDAWNYEQDPEQYLNSESLFATIRKQLKQNPRLFSDLLKSFTSGPQRQQLILCSNNVKNFAQRYIDNESTRLKAAEQDADFKQRTLQLNASLKERQSTVDDVSILPQLSLSDINTQTIERKLADSWIQCTSNGLSHLSYVYQFNDMSKHDLQSLRFLSQCIGELGHADVDYQDIARHINQYCGSFTGSVQCWDTAEGELIPCLHIDAWGLCSDVNQIAELMLDHGRLLRTDEHDRILELLIQKLQTQKDRVVSGGNAYAALHAASFCSPIATMHNQTRGIPYLQFLVRQAVNTDILTGYAQQQHNPTTYLIECSDKQCLDPAYRTGEITTPKSWATFNPRENTVDTNVRAAFVINSDVQFNALAFRAPDWQDPDAAALSVAGQLLSNVFLHPEIREAGGAYGASAYYSGQQRAFICSTYRDPQLDRSFEVMRKSITQLLHFEISDMQLEEAIISTLAELQKPGSPFSDSKRFLLRALRGESVADHLQFQERIKSCTRSDIKRAVEQHLLDKPANACTLAGEKMLGNSALQWQTQSLLGLATDS